MSFGISVNGSAPAEHGEAVRAAVDNFVDELEKIEGANLNLIGFTDEGKGRQSFSRQLPRDKAAEERAKAEAKIAAKNDAKEAAKSDAEKAADKKAADEKQEKADDKAAGRKPARRRTAKQKVADDKAEKDKAAEGEGSSS